MPIYNDPEGRDDVAGRGGPVPYHRRGASWGAGILLLLMVVVLLIWWA